VREEGEPPGGPRGSEGIYDVTFVLGVPGVSSVATSFDVPAMLESGDSLIASGDLQVALRTPDGSSASTWFFRTNEHGRLGKAEIFLQVGGFADAEREAYNQIMPQLSRLAVAANVGIDVPAIVIRERATETLRVGANLVGAVRTVSESAGLMTPDVAPLLATYREGLNSTAPLYQALSFFKVAEGVTTFHTKRVREAKRQGQPPPDDPVDMRIPGKLDDVPDQSSRDAFSDYLGATFGQVKEAFADVIRNAVAHLTPGRDVRVADRLEDIEACRRAIPVLRYVAREMILKELNST
jgi:hypothetical protein